MLVSEEDARDCGSDISMPQVPKQSWQASVRPNVVSDFSRVIPLDSSPTICSEKMSDGGLDSDENLSLHNGSPLRASELNPHAGGIFASNKPVAVLTMTDDSVHDFNEPNGGKPLSLATEIDMELDDASLCTKGEISDSMKAASVLSIAVINLCNPTAESLVFDSCSNTLFEEVTVRGICESKKLLPQEESHIIENELNLDTVDEQFASNKSASALTMMDEDTTDLHINISNNCLAAEIGTKSDDKNLCGEDVYDDSVKILAVNHMTKINFGEKEKDEVDFDYQHINLNGRNNLEAFKVASHSDKRLVDAAETFLVDHLVMPVCSSRFGSDNNSISKSGSLMTNNHVKDDNALNMVQAKPPVPEEHCTEHEDCQIDEELEEHCMCDGLLVDNHVQSNVFNVKLDLEVQEVNYDNCISDGISEVDEIDKATQNSSNIHHQSTCIVENQIIDGAPEMLLVMPRPGKQLLEESNTSSEAVSFEPLNVLESSVAESSSGTRYFILQNDADVLLDYGNQHIDLAREVDDYASCINMLQSPDLCPTVASPEKIQRVSTDSGDFAHSSLVDVSMLGESVEGVDHVIVDDHTNFDQSLDTKPEKYYGSNSKIDGLANLEEAELCCDHISSFFFSDNLFTPFSSHFRRRDGRSEWDPSLSTEELLQLSCSVVGKEMQIDLPYSVANMDGRPVCGTTDNLCMDLNMKGKEVDLIEPAELADSDNMHLVDEHETCCLTNFPFEKDEGSPITGYEAMTGEVEKDGSISSSYSSEVDERQRKPFEGNHLFVVYQEESDAATINYLLDHHDSLDFQDTGAEPNDTEMLRGVGEGQSVKVSKLDTSEKYKMEHTAEETVATAKLDQEKASYTDGTVASEEELFTGSVHSSVSDSEHHAGEHSTYYGSSPLLSSQVEHCATSSTADKQSAEACQFTASESAGYDFNFRGASKLVDQFDECLAKESEGIGKDGVHPEEDKYSDNIMTCKRPSFQECCGVWDWLRGFRG